MTRIESGGNRPDADPFVGPRPLERGERIYGRRAELNELCDKLIARRIVVLHSASGAGKSSLVQAGLIPMLEDEDFSVGPVIRVNREPPADHADRRYIFSALLSLEEGRPKGRRRSSQQLAGLSLEEYLKAGFPGGKPGSVPCLIFDQFEEILTVDPLNLSSKEGFFGELGRLLQNRDVWALFVLRDEYLAPLQPYRRLVPTGLMHALRLDLLSRKAAAQAISLPARLAGLPFTREAVEELVQDLAIVRVQQLDGSFRSVPGVHIEPVQLQVVCQKLWRKLSGRVSEIGAELLGKTGDVNAALCEYYQEQVFKASKGDPRLERTIRQWIGNKLIEGGIRSQVRKGEGESDGLGNHLIEGLRDAHLVRAEQRQGTTWFELAHDRLIGPVSVSNASWLKENLAPWQHQALLWEKQGEPDYLLLKSTALRRAQAADREHSLGQNEKKLLKRSLKARRRLWLSGSMILLFLALCSFLLHRCQVQKELAENQSRIAHSRQLTSMSQLTPRNDLAALLAVEAHRHNSDAETRSNLFRALQLSSGRLWRTLRGHEEPLFKVSWRPDGTALASAGDDQSVMLWDVRSGQLIGSHQQHEDSIKQLAWSPDGGLLASGDTGGSILIWAPGGQAWPLSDDSGSIGSRAHPVIVISLAWQPVGTLAGSGADPLLASAGLDGTVKIWRAASKTLLHTLRGHQGPVTALAWHPQGGWLASGGNDQTVRFWETQSGRPIGNPLLHDHMVENLAWDADGGLAAGTKDGWVVWRSPAPGQLPSQKFPGLTNQGLTFVAWLNQPQGQSILAAGGGSGIVTFHSYPFDGAQPAISAAGIDSPVTDLSASPDGSAVSSSHWSGQVRIWRPAQPQSALRLVGHQDKVESIGWSPDGVTLASVGADATVKLWRSEPTGLATLWPESLDVALQTGGENVAGLVWADDASRLDSIGVTGVIRLWRPDSALELQRVDPPQSAQDPGPVKSVAVARSTGIQQPPVAWCFAEGQIQIWNPSFSQPYPAREEDYNNRCFVAWSPEGRVLASGGSDRKLRFWGVDLDDEPGDEFPGRLLHEQELPVGFSSLAWNSSGLLSGGFEDGSIRVWRIGSEQLDQLQQGASLSLTELLASQPRNNSERVTAQAWSDDGQMLAVGHLHGNVALWQAFSDSLVREFAAHGQQVTALAWSPVRQWRHADEPFKALASGSLDGRVSLWDPRSGELISVPVTHPKDVTALAWRPDGGRNQLAAAFRSGVMRIIDLDEGKWLQRAERIVGRNLSCEEWKTHVGDLAYQKTFKKLPGADCPR